MNISVATQQTQPSSAPCPGAEIIPFPDRACLDVEAVLASSQWGSSGPHEDEVDFDEAFHERVMASSHLRRRAG